MFDWPHAPPHRFGDAGVYFVTAGTYKKQPWLTSPASRDHFQQLLFELAREEACRLQVWCVLTNHYHLVASTDDGPQLEWMLTRLHTKSALDLNEFDRTPGRKVWLQFRDTQLTYERSWLARLRYVQENAVHHGIVRKATDYRWCSAAWFEERFDRAFVQTVSRMQIDALKVYADF
jgi:putative transposase